MTRSTYKSKHAVTNRLWRYRTAQQVSQKHIAKLLGHKNTAQISRWENGKKTPTLANALMLGHVLKAPVEALFAERAAELHAELDARAASIPGGGERISHVEKARSKA